VFLEVTGLIHKPPEILVEIYRVEKTFLKILMLPESVIDATSVNSFKNRLNNHWKNIEIKFVPDFYGPEAGISRNDNVMDLRGQS
jgi:hypothetical protein